MASSSKRFAAVSAQDPTTLLATFSIAINADGHFNLSANGEDEGKSREILAIAERALKESARSAADTEDLLLWAEQAITSAFEQTGRSLRPLPDGDFQIKFQIDLNNRRSVGEHTTLHSFADPNEKLAAQISEAISTSLQKGAIDLTAALKASLAKGDMAEAASKIQAAFDAGVFALPVNRELRDTVSEIDVVGLPQADRSLIRGLRLTLAQLADAHDIAGQEAEVLLAEHDDELDDGKRAHLQMVIATAAQQNGQSETAMTIWRDLLSRPDVMDGQNRGWAWRNIAVALGPQEAEAQQAARRSADAFLEAGNKQQAGNSLKVLSDCLVHEQPARAVIQLDEIVALMDQNELIGRDLRAGALLLRGKFLGQLGRHREALHDALEAVKLHRGLIDREVQLVSSLNMVLIEAEILGEAEAYATLKDEAEKLGREIKNPRFRFAERVVALQGLFNADEAEALVGEATAAGDLDIVASVRILQATETEGLSLSRRLQILEKSLRELEYAKVSREIEEPILMAITRLLLEAKEFRRAIPWTRKILKKYTLNRWARDVLVYSLWELKEWGEAAVFLKKHIEQFGELPGLMTAYGRSLLEAGDVSAAVPVLTKAIELAGDEQNAHRAAFNLRERALKLGGTVPQPVPVIDLTAPVTTEELREALSGYAQHIAEDRRMSFWSMGAKDYGWIANPERHAQNLLHTYLKGRLQERVAVFEELNVGAGRLDLYLQVVGGLSAVIELKMCGFGYSSPYAAAGEDQILHYMENKRTHLGYLVVHDARLDKFGEALLAPRNPGSNSVVEIIVDVRPRVSSRRSSRPTAKKLIR